MLSLEITWNSYPPFLGVRFISINDGYDSANLKDGEYAGRFEEVLEATELTQENMSAFLDYVDVFEGDRIHIHWKFDSKE